MISNSDDSAITSKTQSKFTTSTLNPSEYKKYIGGNSLRVSLMRTWICPGYTGAFKETCPHPYDKERSKNE